MAVGPHLIARTASKLLSRRTLSLLRFDLLRATTRLRQRRATERPARRRLHFGCGSTQVQGWLNVDLTHSDQNVDLTAGPLPWPDGTFDVAASQHVIEHLELTSELLPLLTELSRVLVPGGELWLSCPDMEKLCRSYLEHRMRDLVEDRERRSRLHWKRPWTLDAEVGIAGVPTSQMLNSVFYQGHEHRNLFDFELLEWALRRSGFTEVERTDETAWLERFPEFPSRGDDAQSLYVRARIMKRSSGG